MEDMKKEEKKEPGIRTARKQKLLAVGMVLGFWSCVLLPNLLYPLVREKFEGENQENRVLAERPAFSLVPLRFHPEAWDAYINDHAPFRDAFISAYVTMNMELFDSIDSRVVLKGKDGWLFYADGECLPDYQRTNRFTEDELVLLAKRVQTAKEHYAQLGKEFIVILAPNKSEIYPENMPDYIPRKEGDSRLMQLASYLREHTETPVLTPEDWFREKAAGLPLYYKTDTHWNALGAFLASQQLIEALGGEAVSPDQVQVSFAENTPGDLARMVHLPVRYAADTQAVIEGYYDELTINTINADAFHYRMENETPGAPDPRHVVVYRDSFAESMMPFLGKYFAKTSAFHYSVFDSAWVDASDADVVVYEVVERQLDRILTDLDLASKLDPSSVQPDDLSG